MDRFKDLKDIIIRDIPLMGKALKEEGPGFRVLFVFFIPAFIFVVVMVTIANLLGIKMDEAR